MPEREFDVVVFGASSVTGRRVAAYLEQRTAEVGATWAAAGRNPERLAEVLAAEGVQAPAVIPADVEDHPSLAEMASRARVVLNLVGPYTLHGQPVIRGCVENGAHYVDLTGEIPLVRRIIREFDAPAKAAGVKIVQVCGFEALPPDLGVLLAAEAARERYDADVAEADVAITLLALPPGVPRPSDFVSGGTMQSLAEAVGDDDAAVIRDPACLIDDAQRAAEVRARSPIALAPRRGPGNAVIAPMAPAAFINPAVIHRTAALAEPPLPPFRYREGFATTGGAASLPLRLMAAAALSGGQVGARAIATAGAGTRRRASSVLRRVLPDSGFGPAGDRLEPWRWRMTVSATTTGGDHIEVRADGDGHPGYLTTARMLGEAGLLLASPDATPDRAGCLTPALAIGTDSIERFDAAGLRFRVQPPG